MKCGTEVPCTEHLEHEGSKHFSMTKIDRSVEEHYDNSLNRLNGVLSEIALLEYSHPESFRSGYSSPEMRWD